TTYSSSTSTTFEVKTIRMCKMLSKSWSNPPSIDFYTTGVSKLISNYSILINKYTFKPNYNDLKNHSVIANPFCINLLFESIVKL
ncbi:hypothetical protein ACQP3C_29525, partial [Escherichia coli]